MNGRTGTHAHTHAPSPPAPQLNRPKSRFSPHRGQFSTKKLSAFLTGLASGRIGTQAIQSLPPFADAAADMEVQAVEEEFSLDDIMNEEM